jgi:predicted flap endonuclease-1-like 5' DNA nuclease
MLLNIFTDCNGEFHFWPLLFLLLAALLGWLLRHLMGGDKSVDVDGKVSAAVSEANSNWQYKYNSLEAELKKLKSAKASGNIAMAAAAPSSTEPLSEINRWKDKAMSFEKNIGILRNEKELVDGELNNKTRLVNELTTENERLKSLYNAVKTEIEAKAKNLQTPMAVATPTPVEEKPAEVKTIYIDASKELEEKVIAIQAKLKEADNANADIRERLHLADKKNVELQMRIKTTSDLASEATALKARIAQFESSGTIKTYEAEYNQSKNEVAKLKADVEAANAKASAALSVKTYEAEYNQSQADIAKLKADVEAANAKVSAASSVKTYEAEYNQSQADIAKLKADVEAANAKVSAASSVKTYEGEYNAANARIAELEAQLASAKTEQTVMAASLKETKKDDLTKIEGVGPAIAKLFNEDGMHTFDDVATAGTPRLQAVLDKAGDRFKIHNPGTWCEQAAMARDGKWAELKAWQDNVLDGGVDYSKTPDDLKKIEGIGPVIEGLLNKANIYTFKKLAATPVGGLRDILEEAGERFRIHDPATWPDQAELARDGKWEQLQKMQDELKGGRDVNA